MAAKDEFYKNVRDAFTEDEVISIRGLVDQLEKDLPNNPLERYDLEKDYLYYDLCRLLCVATKDYDIFVASLKGRQLNRALEVNFNAKLVEDNEKDALYTKMFHDIDKFVNDKYHTTFYSKKLQDLAIALTNAVYPKVLENKERENYLGLYKDILETRKVINKVEKGGRITRISVDVNGQGEAVLTSTRNLTKCWKNSLGFALSMYRGIPSELEKTIRELEKLTLEFPKHIALRICMVFVQFGILQKTTASTRFLLVNRSGERVLLSRPVMENVHQLMQKLDVVRDAHEGLDRRDVQDRVMNLLRSGKKGINDTFSYDDIGTTWFRWST